MVCFFHVQVKYYFSYYYIKYDFGGAYKPMTMTMDRQTAFLTQLNKLKEKRDGITYNDVIEAFSGFSLKEEDIDQILETLGVENNMFADPTEQIDPRTDFILGENMDESVEDISAELEIPDAEPTAEDLKTVDLEFEEDLTEESLEKELKESESIEGLSDSTRFYIREASKYNLLTAEEEVKYAMLMEEGLEAQKKLDIYGNRMNDANRRELEVKIRKGKEAREMMINCNLRLVIKLSKRFLFAKTLEYSDLIEEGNIGLIRAADKFDYHKGYKFSTYAVWWIRQSIIRGISDTDRLIRIPVHMVESMNRIIKAQKQLLLQNGHEATVDEIVEYTGMSRSKVADLLRIASDPLSLDAGMGDDEDYCLGDAVADTEAMNPEEFALLSGLKDQMDYLLRTTMTNREAHIIRMRFGINKENREYTLEELGKIYGLTRERIRQIESKALRKLRHPARIKYLESYRSK